MTITLDEIVERHVCYGCRLVELSRDCICCRWKDSLISDIKQYLLENLADELENPYPEDIFIEPTKDQYRLIHEILVKNGLTLDKFSGAWGRKVWNNCVKKLKDRIERIGGF